MAASSSDDDVPLGQRNAQTAAPAVPQPAQQPKEEPVTSPDKPVIATAKPQQSDGDSSDDEVPIGQLKREPNTDNKPAPKAAGKSAVKKEPESGDKKKLAVASKTKAGAAADKPAAKAVAGPKKKAAAAAEVSNGTAADKVKREKKVYDMPGQTRDTPVEIDPLRRFYTSLKEQQPGSEMATRWCAQHGLLPREEAEAWVLEQAQKRKANGLSPSKPAAKKKPAANSAAKRKRAAADSDDDEEAFKSEKKRPAAKKPAPTKKPAAANKPAAAKKAPAAAAKRPAPARDVAFADGGLDGSDSDDDVPLLARARK